jgi:Bacterial extracellular solute-binding proteins, family 5 Middle
LPRGRHKVSGVRRSEFLAGIAAASSLRPGMPRLSIVAAPLGHDIDPYRDQERGIDELAWLFADGLVGPDERPLLAASAPEIRAGGTTYRYILRNATWHDGVPFTARDVETAFLSIRDALWGTHEPYRSVRAVTPLDERRFDVHLHAPRTNFVRSFFGAFGVPALPFVRRAWDGTPLGTGPFAVVARPEPERWTLRRWDRSPRGRSEMQEIGVRLIGFPPTRAIQMRTEEAHIAIPLAPDAMAGNYSKLTRLTSVASLAFNTSEVFHTARSRRLCAQTLNLSALQEFYLNRKGVPLFASLLMNGANDPAWERALAQRGSAGRELRDALGEIVVRLVYAGGSPSHERTMLQLQQMLKRDAGVASHPMPTPFETYLAVDGPLRAGTFDIAVIGYPNIDGSDLAADWACINAPPRGGNFTRWCDDATERALRRGDAGGVLRRIYDEMAVLPLGLASEHIGVSERLAGVIPPRTLVPFTYHCTEWRWA